ncbi:MAG: uracil-DNA glycosylase [Alphaproteobacteria bacterium]|nr:uracil-DNA glycosylase [Alphaproteobacteria bacterium]
MSDCDLRDLELAGVVWELSDTPISAPRPRTVLESAPVESPRQTAATVIAEIGRGPATVVPPIAPAQTVSVDTVRAMASRPTDMATLKRMIGELNHPLRGGATNTVLPHVGNGDLMILTDIPSSDDDATGTILSGAAGELMDKMLAAIGLSRMCVSIIPMVFWRTPGGRTPTRTELDLTRPFIDRTTELLKPRVILTLGTLPAAEMAGVNLAKSHGVPVSVSGGVTLVPIFHPNYLILKPAAKRDVWTALQNVQNILKSAE